MKGCAPGLACWRAAAPGCIPVKPEPSAAMRRTGLEPVAGQDGLFDGS